MPPAAQRDPPIPADVRAAYDRFPDPVRARLLAVRSLIFETAAGTPGVGPLTETLKWGEPAYLTEASRSGSTIRLGQSKDAPDCYAVFFNCRTRLVEDIRAHFPTEFRFDGNRALLMETAGPLPESALSICLAMALTYHRRTKTSR